METCGDRLGDFILRAPPRGSRATSVGKNPSVWTPAKLREGDEGYVAGEERYEGNWRGHGKLLQDVRAYRGTQSEAGPMIDHLRRARARRRCTFASTISNAYASGSIAASWASFRTLVSRGASSTTR